MGMHHIDRDHAQEAVGRALELLGWKLWGHHEDKSDSMTDYYCPASWDGVATQEIGGELVIACVDVSSYIQESRSGDTPERRTQRDVGDCERCGGDGTDPEIPYTLETARLDSEGYHDAYSAVHCPGAVSLFRSVVSPLQFTSSGNPKCRDCHATGKRRETVISYGARWPEFHKTPKGATWHIERGGEIVTKGTGLSKALRSDEGAECVAKVIHNAATIAREIATGDAVHMRRNPEKNGVELRFEAKPPDNVRHQLKAAGFRWSRRGACWYKRATPDAIRFAEMLVDGIAADA